MKRIIGIISVLLCSISLLAQSDKDTERNNFLIHVDKEQERAIFEEDLSLRFYAEEISRLLIPTNTSFGMVLKPSLFKESSITYDTEQQMLVYTTIDDNKTIWGCVCDATEIIEDGVTRLRDKPENYTAPKMKNYRLAISKKAAKNLAALWTAAINAARPSKTEHTYLDGTSREFFINGRYAQARGAKDGRVLRLINLINGLRTAILEGDTQRAEMLCQESVTIKESFQK